jgi:hypothetical protein
MKMNSMDAKCVLTDAPILDDCHITIEFGFGSDKDMTTYNFSPVSDEVGRQVLETLSKLSRKNIEQFGRDVMEEEWGPSINQNKS